MMRFLTVCGSLRAGSSNRAVLDAIWLLASENLLVEGSVPIDALPHFSPDLESQACRSLFTI